MADIAMRGVRKSYGRDEVVHGVDLDIRTGEFIVILGPSGCGKSTLLRMIAGLEDVTSGEILIDNKVVNGLEPRERGCAMVFQNYALYPHMTVAENIGYSLKVEGMRKALRRQKVEEVAAAVGLSDYLDRKPGALSGGQRQRVAMARAVIRAPKVFLFDEPLSNLDAGLRVRMRHEIRRIHNKIKATSIFVTHDQHEGMTLADRLIIMNKGIVEQIGTPEEVYDRPASVYVAGFIGSPAMNFMPAEVNDSASAAVLSDGTSVVVDGRVMIRPQQMLQLGLRPELLDLGPRGAGRIPVRFEFAEEMGPARLCHVSYEDLMLTVLVDRKINYCEGQELGIIQDPSDLHLFDAESGMRCDADLTGAGRRRYLPEETGIVPCCDPVGQPTHTVG